MQLTPVLYSQFVPPDRRPDRVLIGEARPEDGVRILETNPSAPASSVTLLAAVLAARAGS